MSQRDFLVIQVLRDFASHGGGGTRGTVRRHRGPLQFGRSDGWGKRGRICGGVGQIFGDDWLAGEEGKRTLLVGEVAAVVQRDSGGFSQPGPKYKLPGH
jgi:hypothetical protein